MRHPARHARNIIVEFTFDVGRRFRCRMRVDCGQLNPDAVIQPIRGEWQPRMPERLDEDELARRPHVLPDYSPDLRRLPTGSYCRICSEPRA